MDVAARAAQGQAEAKPGGGVLEEGARAGEVRANKGASA